MSHKRRYRVARKSMRERDEPMEILPRWARAMIREYVRSAFRMKARRGRRKQGRR